MATQEEFEAAAERAKKLSEQSNENLLKLYSLYKQASVGDVSGQKPGLFDFVAKAKYEAWEKVQGMPSEDAKQQYVTLVEALEES